MGNSTLISVITPIHSTNHKLPEIRKALSLTAQPTQLILVLNNPKLSKQILPQTPNELVVVAPKRGRGFAFLQGIANIKGKITMLLHSDTVPPRGWDHLILEALKNPNVVGGGFSLSYDITSPYLEIVSGVSNLWVRLTGELYGDRAMFVRSHILRRCRSVLEVPIFEDYRLTKCMHKQGRVVLLKQKVVTSAGSYQKYGLVGYIVRIWLSRFWYGIGGSPFQIYNAYYSTSKSD